MNLKKLIQQEAERRFPYVDDSSFDVDRMKVVQDERREAFIRSFDWLLSTPVEDKVVVSAAKFTMKDFEKGLMLAGYVTPKNEEEVEEKRQLEEYERSVNAIQKITIHSPTVGKVEEVQVVNGVIQWQTLSVAQPTPAPVKEGKALFHDFLQLTQEDADELCDLLKMELKGERLKVVSIISTMFKMNLPCGNDLLMRQFTPLEFVHIHQFLTERNYTL